MNCKDSLMLEELQVGSSLGWALAIAAESEEPNVQTMLYQLNFRTLTAALNGGLDRFHTDCFLCGVH